MVHVMTSRLRDIKIFVIIKLSNNHQTNNSLVIVQRSLLSKINNVCFVCSVFMYGDGKNGGGENKNVNNN